ncbi:MAG: VOC family protein [Anaerolineae bacterium]
MKFLHTMVRVLDEKRAMHFFCDLLGFKEVRRIDSEEGKFSLIYLESSPGDPPVELTVNWGETEPYSVGRSFGHIALEVDNIYETCAMLQENGTTILRPPRDGRMAFVKTPDGISIEFLQAGGSLEPAEPWLSMPSTGSW